MLPERRRGSGWKALRSALVGNKQVCKQAVLIHTDVTSSALSAVRGVKLSGLTEKVTTIIQSLRMTKLNSAGSYRLWECAALMTGEIVDLDLLGRSNVKSRLFPCFSLARTDFCHLYWR
jgi:hypothetical protein